MNPNAVNYSGILVMPPERKVANGDLPDFITLTSVGKIVSAQCESCGAFVGASESIDNLKMVLKLHSCVRKSHK